MKRTEKRPRNRPKAIDVFCGCGGTSLGLRRAGFDVIGGAEVRDDAVAAYRLNHPQAVLFHDVRFLTAPMLCSSLGIRRGALDLLSGCPPCQGFSSMRTLNTRSARKDERNNLVFDFLRLVEGLLPKAVLIENVPGLARNWRFGHLKRDLRRLGYQVRHGILNSRDFGVPQRRKRLVLCAFRTNERIELRYPPAAKTTVRDAIGQLPLPARSDDRLHRMVSKLSTKVRKRIARIPHDGGSRGDLGKTSQLPCHKNEDCGFHDVYGRMSWNEPAPTITRYSNNPSKGRFVHPTQNRGISLLEAALLQSFPKSYKFPADAKITHVASMIGEAFPPLMAEAVARVIKEQITVARVARRHR